MSKINFFINTPIFSFYNINLYIIKYFFFLESFFPLKFQFYKVINLSVLFDCRFGTKTDDDEKKIFLMIMCKRFIIDKQTALKMCKKKLKRTSKLYKKVLIINTLRFIQNSNSIIKYHVSKNDNEWNIYWQTKCIEKSNTHCFNGCFSRGVWFGFSLRLSFFVIIKQYVSCFLKNIFSFLFEFF